MPSNCRKSSGDRADDSSALYSVFSFSLLKLKVSKLKSDRKWLLLSVNQVDYKSFLLDFKSVPNVNNPQIPKPSSEKRHSLTNGNNESRRESNHDVLGEGADKENLLQAVNGVSSNGKDKLFHRLKYHCT